MLYSMKKNGTPFSVPKPRKAVLEDFERIRRKMLREGHAPKSYFGTHALIRYTFEDGTVFTAEVVNDI